MGAAAAPVVGGIITAVLVSEAIKAVGPKLGLSDDVVGITATVAGAYAGGMTYNSAMTASASGTATGAGAANQIGMDLSQGTQLPANPTGSGFSGGVGMQAGSTVPAVNPTGSGFTGDVAMKGAGIAPSATTQAQVAPPKSPLTITSDPNDVGGGMLSKAAPPPPEPTTAKNAIDVATTGEVTGEKTWYEKLFTPEKTMDLLMAGMTGYASAGMAKDDREYPEEIAKNNAKDWGKAYPGMLSLSQQYPSQQ